MTGVTTEAVRNDLDNHRLAVDTPVGTAELVYHLDGDRLFLLHTEVPSGLRGQGMGGRLVGAALAWAGDSHLTVVPWCPYARRWLHDHPDRVDGTAIDWSTPAPG
jgi:predicted GNAT family acetyltransferase